mmetsp:Transcript_59178/g.157505  ORF Transcript_59178/g.157505 Transcript_59178/m.157505 type:complete len:233 (-) Transcript_59178:427-1125(-)
MVLNFVGTLNVEHHRTDHLLGNIHKVVVVGVRHVKLAGRELWIVRHVNTLVPEVSANLIDAIEATNHQGLEIQFWCHPHEKIQTEIVVVGHKRLSRGAARNHVHHGRLHLHEATRIEIVSNEGDNLGSDDEGVSHILVHHKVQVPLAIADLWILQGTRQHVQTGREELHFTRKHRKLAALRLANVATETNAITTVDVLVGFREVAICVIRRRSHHLNTVTIGEEIIEPQVLT